MTRILWVSRHMPLPSQIAELKRLYGENTEIVPDPNPFDNAEEIAERAKGYDDVVVVAPLSVIALLVTKYGVEPLWAEMQRVSDPAQAEVSLNGRHFRFKRFRRIVAVTITYEDVQPRTKRKRKERVHEVVRQT